MTVKKCLAASTLWRKKKVTRKFSLRKSAQHILTTDSQTDGRTFFTMELSGYLRIPVVYSRFFTRESPLISFISFRHVDTWQFPLYDNLRVVMKSIRELSVVTEEWKIRGSVPGLAFKFTTRWLTNIVHPLNHWQGNDICFCLFLFLLIINFSLSSGLLFSLFFTRSSLVFFSCTFVVLLLFSKHSFYHTYFILCFIQYYFIFLLPTSSLASFCTAHSF